MAAATLCRLSHLSNLTKNSVINKWKPQLLNRQAPLVQTVAGVRAKPKWKESLTYEKQTLSGSKYRPRWFFDKNTEKPFIPEITEEQEKLATDVTSAINEQIKNDETGRLFAVVHFAGHQFKVTENDVVIVMNHWPPYPGDVITLDKVLVVGGKDFSIVGRPIVNKELVTVTATVIEKSLSHVQTRFNFIAKENYRRIRFYRHEHTMLRINSIQLNRKVDEKKEIEGINRIF